MKLQTLLINLNKEYKREGSLLYSPSILLNANKKIIIDPSHQKEVRAIIKSSTRIPTFISNLPTKIQQQKFNDFSYCIEPESIILPTLPNGNILLMNNECTIEYNPNTGKCISKETFNPSLECDFDGNIFEFNCLNNFMIQGIKVHTLKQQKNTYLTTTAQIPLKLFLHLNHLSEISLNFKHREKYPPLYTFILESSLITKQKLFFVVFVDAVNQKTLAICNIDQLQQNQAQGESSIHLPISIYPLKHIDNNWILEKQECLKIQDLKYTPLQYGAIINLKNRTITPAVKVIKFKPQHNLFCDVAIQHK